MPKSRLTRDDTTLGTQPPEPADALQALRVTRLVVRGGEARNLLDIALSAAALASRQVPMRFAFGVESHDGAAR